MATNETQEYGTETLVAGQIKSRADAPLAIDTYHYGLPLSFVPVVTDGTNTGDGTAVVIGGKSIGQDITVELTAALIAKLTVDSVDVLTGIALTDGGSTIITYKGIEIVVTDGATPFAAADTFVISFDDGDYAIDLVNPQVIYFGADARVLAAAGIGSVLLSGDVLGSGLVDGAGAALTITEGLKQALLANGIVVK